MQTESYDNPLMAQNRIIEREFTEKDRARQWTALWILAASGLMGLVGDLFFFHQGYGVNVDFVCGGVFWGRNRVVVGI